MVKRRHHQTTTENNLKCRFVGKNLEKLPLLLLEIFQETIKQSVSKFT